MLAVSHALQQPREGMKRSSSPKRPKPPETCRSEGGRAGSMQTWPGDGQSLPATATATHSASPGCTMVSTIDTPSCPYPKRYFEDLVWSPLHVSYAISEHIYFYCFPVVSLSPCVLALISSTSSHFHASFFPQRADRSGVFVIAGG